MGFRHLHGNRRGSQDGLRCNVHLSPNIGIFGVELVVLVVKETGCEKFSSHEVYGVLGHG